MSKNCVSWPPDNAEQAVEFMDKHLRAIEASLAIVEE
jgi:hypothetical protein